MVAFETLWFEINSTHHFGLEMTVETNRIVAKLLGDLIAHGQKIMFRV